MPDQDPQSHRMSFNLRELREHKNLTLLDLAKRIGDRYPPGISVAKLFRLESGTLGRRSLRNFLTNAPLIDAFAQEFNLTGERFLEEVGMLEESQAEDIALDLSELRERDDLPPGAEGDKKDALDWMNEPEGTESLSGRHDQAWVARYALRHFTDRPAAIFELTPRTRRPTARTARKQDLFGVFWPASAPALPEGRRLYRAPDDAMSHAPAPTGIDAGDVLVVQLLPRRAVLRHEDVYVYAPEKNVSPVVRRYCNSGTGGWLRADHTDQERFPPVPLDLRRGDVIGRVEAVYGRKPVRLRKEDARDVG